MTESLILMLQSAFGFLALIGIAIALSENRALIEKGYILKGFGLYIFLAILLILTPADKYLYDKVSSLINIIKLATKEGTQFVFGYIGGGAPPFETTPNLKKEEFILAFQALPLIIVISALSMLLFYWRIIPFIVKWLSKVFQKSLGIGGALGIIAGAKLFFSHIEAAFLIRPYLKKLNRSELFMLITCGMATTSATVMPLFATILEDTVPHAMSYILTSAVINIIASITLARIVVPPSDKPTSGDISSPYQFSNSMDAIARGTSDGLQIFMQVLGILLVMSALVFIGNALLETLPLWQEKPITIQRVLGVLLAPLTWLMGIPWQDTQTAGQVLGTKIILNEVLGFFNLANSNLDQRSLVIMTFGLCGFANLTTLGMTISAFGSMIPARRTEIAELGWKALITGTLTTCLSGSLIGFLLTLRQLYCH